MTMRNAIINRKTGNMTISKLNLDALQNNEDNYELVILRKGDKQKPSLSNCIYKLPELLQRNNGYGLVTEVYVNNGFNNGSTPSSPGDSPCSTIGRKPKFYYKQSVDNPGSLLIEVKDCPDNYIKVEDSDSFEPDTLDRKPSKILKKTDYDSLERPNQILLRTTGSFKNSSMSECTFQEINQNFNRNFGSLREIYEAKLKRNQTHASVESVVWDQTNENDEGKLLTLEERHCRRQRKLTLENSIPPDVIPPPPHDSGPIYEHPKPPRKIILEDFILKPPLPPKNAVGRSTLQNLNQVNIKFLGYKKSCYLYTSFFL